jgi:hypothetical protein
MERKNKGIKTQTVQVAFRINNSSESTAEELEERGKGRGSG